MKLHLRADGDTALCDEKIKRPLTSLRLEVTCATCKTMTKAKRGGR